MKGSGPSHVRRDPEGPAPRRALPVIRRLRAVGRPWLRRLASRYPGSPRRGASRRRRSSRTEETDKAEQLFKSGRYPEAVAEAKAALTKNERYTPAMLVMAKSFYKLHKFEWMKKLWEMMQANGASNAEKAEVYQMLAFLEVDQKNVPGAIVLFKQATEAKPDDADPLEQPRGAVPGSQELHRGHPGPGEGGQPSTGIRQGPSKPG